METRPRIVREKDPFNPEGRRGLVASSFPMAPPRDWFEDPQFSPNDGRMVQGIDGSWACPLTITADGRVYGHIAAWSARHIGLPGNVPPPRSRTNYGYFHTGVVACADGTDVPVGQLTLAGGHAPLSADAGAAVKHYDDTASAVVDMHVGEDKYGIWAAGAVRPNVDEMQLRALRASAPSGDWRPIGGGLELVAVCQVNVPGFPTARARVAGGAVTALVAAGASDMLMRRYRSVDEHSVVDRLHQLEAIVASLTEREKKELRGRVQRDPEGAA